MMFDIGQALQDAFDDGYRKRDAEIVRCKDCRWYINDRLKKDGTEDNRYAPSICSLHGKPPISKDFFCAYGERMEIEDENAD